MKKALVVGINAYPRAVLHGCVNDALAVSKSLETNTDGSKNFEVRLEKDVFTKCVLREKIVNLFKGSCDTALLYFSGHGYINELGGYLVTPDQKRYDEGILMDEVLKLANTSGATNKIIILDCCNAGAMGSPAILGTGASFLNEGVTILSASKRDESSVEINGHGIFTSLLIEALNGGAADISGHITLASIYAFIDKALGPFDQRPVFKTNTVQFNPLRLVTPRVSSDILKKITDYFSAPDMEYRLNPSYEDTNIVSAQHFAKTPYADENNIIIFKHLQKFQSVGLVVPVNAPFMFFAAMNSTSCKLTALGQQYWRLVKNNRI